MKKYFSQNIFLSCAKIIKCEDSVGTYNGTSFPCKKITLLDIEYGKIWFRTSSRTFKQDNVKLVDKFISCNFIANEYKEPKPPFKHGIIFGKSPTNVQFIQAPHDFITEPHIKKWLSHNIIDDEVIDGFGGDPVKDFFQ